MSNKQIYIEKLQQQDLMSEALIEAQKAFNIEEAPIGAVIVKDGKIIARAHNLVEKLKDPCAHAELLAIKDAVQALDSKYLFDCDIYVSLEPCPMCAGAIVLSKIRSVHFAAFDSKMGAVSSLYSIVQDSRLNHQTNVSFGLLQEESSDLLKKFFKDLR